MLAAILAVVALVTSFAVATVVFLDERGTAGLTTELETRAGADLALRASLDRAEDAAAQDAEVRAAIDRTFAATGVDFTVTRSLESEAYYKVPAVGDELRTGGPAVAASYVDLESRAQFETGGVPADDHEVAVQADAAALIGLEVGDEVLLNDVLFTVSGTWRALDPLDPRWYGDEIVATGGEARLGPFVIDESGWSQFGSPPVAIWTLAPASLNEITATNFESVISAWDRAQDAWRGTVSEYETIAIQRRLARTLDEFAVRIDGLRAIEPVAFVLMAGSALVALSQVIQLLVATRERESELFWARGQSPVGVARRLTLEVAVAALLGAVLGGAAVIGGMIGLGQSASLTGIRSNALAVPSIVVGGAILVAAIVAYRSALSVSTPTRGGRAEGRVRRVAIPGVIALVSIAAVLSVWQLRLYGSPLTPSADGSSSIDPIAVAAPALALVAVVLIGLAVFPALVRVYDRRTSAGGVRAHLSARTLVRDARRVVAPLVVVALAVGSATVAATFSATWSTAFDRSAELHAGADLRVSSRFSPLSAAQREAVGRTDGVQIVAPVDVQTLSVGTVTGTTLAATPGAVRELITTAGGTFSPEDAASAIALEQPGPVIAEGTESVTVRVEALGFVEPPTLGAWIADELGGLHPVTFGEPEEEPEGVLAYTAPLDGEVGTLLAFDVGLPVQDVENRPSFRLLELVAATSAGEDTQKLDQFWVVDTLRSQLYPPIMFADGSGFTLDFGLPSVRMTAAIDGTAVDQLRPEVLVSQRLATLLELKEGDLIAFSIRDGVERINAFVAGIVPAIPGARTGSAVLMDLAVNNHLQLRTERVPGQTTDLWVSTDDPEKVREEIRPALPANTRIDTSADLVGRQVLGAASIALWGAAVCCLLIAIVAVSSASQSRVRWGRNDIASLRAVGLGARDQSAVLLREFGVVLGAATVIGFVAGAVVSVLTVPELARAAVDRSYLESETGLSIDWLGLGMLLLALATGVALVLAGLTRRVRVLASTSLPSEGHE